MINRYLFFLLVFFTSTSMAQEMSFSQDLERGFMINPAFAGNKNSTEVGVINRMQWVGSEYNNPSRLAVYFNTPSLHKTIGFGTIVSRQTFGTETQLQFIGKACYKLHLKNATFSMGLEAGIQQFSNDFSKINTGGNDPVASGNNSTLLPVIGAGVNYEHRFYFVSFSGQNLTKTEYQNSDYQNSLARQTQCFNLFMGGKIQLNNALYLMPILLTKHIPEMPIYYNLSLLLNNEKKFWGGVSINNNIEYGIQGGIKLNDFLNGKHWVMLGYAFQYGTSPIYRVTAGTHEVMLKVGFQSNKHSATSFFD